MQMLRELRFWAVVTGIIELALCCHGTTLFSTQEVVMRRNNYFSDQSENQKKLTYARLYTITTTTFRAFQAFAQVLSDRIGQWKVRGLVALLCTIGAILNGVAFYSSSLNWLVWLGYPLMFGCGSAYIYSYVILMELYPDLRATISQLIGSSFGVVFGLYLWYESMPRPEWFFFLMAIFQVVFFFRMFVFLPRMNSVYAWDGEEKVRQIGWASRKNAQVFKQGKDSAFFSPDTAKQIFTTKNCLLLAWFVVNDIRANVYVSQNQPWLEWVCQNETNIFSDEPCQNYWQDWYNYAGLIGIAINPIIGIAQDGLKKFIAKTWQLKQLQAQAVTAICFMLIISISFAMSSLFMAIQIPNWQILYIYLSINAMGATRFVTRSIFIVATCPIQYFGTILAVFSLSQIAVAFTTSLWSNFAINVLGGNYGNLNFIMAGLCLAGVVFPVILGFMVYKEIKAEPSGKSEGVVNKVMQDS